MKFAACADTTYCEGYTMSALRIFVRRGALRRYDRLKKDAEGLPVQVEWDRRKSDRRGDTPTAPEPESSEQRQAERRREPPFTWAAGEFVVVNDPPADDSASDDSPDED
jgi:hypothetical protein